MRKIGCLIAVLLVGLFGCGTKSVKTDVPLSFEMPKAYLYQASGQIQFEGKKWWHCFENKELNHLIDQALAHNFEIRVLKSRVQQAEAAVRQIKASFFPTLDFSFGGDRTHTRTKTDTSTKTDGSHSWDASLGAVFTPDIWGKLSAQQKAKVYELEAARKDLDLAVLELTQTISENWLDIITVREKQKILARQVENNKTLLKLQKLRFVNGRASALEVSQQQEALAQASAQVPVLAKQEATLLNTLVYLCGRPDSPAIAVTTKGLPELKQFPSQGVPADLLEKRPDIKAAQLRFLSSQWNIKAAERNRFPDLRLTAQALFSNGALDLLFHNWVASLAASLAGNVFDGGVKTSIIEQNQAAAGERAALYAQVVAQAVREVEDSLVNIRHQDAYVELLEKELATARVTLKDALVQYRNGQSSYLNYLTTWTKIQSLERSLQGEKASAVKARISLFRSLGWTVPPETQNTGHKSDE